MASLIAFFMTGLPGGIDYWLLARVKEGTLPRMEVGGHSRALSPLSPHPARTRSRSRSNTPTR